MGLKDNYFKDIKSRATNVIRIEFEHKMDNIITKLTKKISLHLDTLKSQKKLEEEQVALPIFSSKCKMKHPLHNFHTNVAKFC